MFDGCGHIFGALRGLIVDLMVAALSPRFTHQHVVIVNALTQLVQRQRPHSPVDQRQTRQIGST